MRLNRAQRAILALGMLGLVGLLLWVPYSATYKGSKSLTADAGYQWVFSPPNANICRASIEEYADAKFDSDFNPGRCEVRLDLRRLGLTVAAAALGIGALVLILGLLGRRDQAPPRREATLAELSGARDRRPVSDTVRSLLARNPNLPISAGDLTEADPLVITAKTNYVPVEYQVMEAVHANWTDIEMEMKSQGLSEVNGRKIDELTFRYRKAGQEEWGYEKTYYFDVTIGMAELRRQIEGRWWQFWK